MALLTEEREPCSGPRCVIDIDAQEEVRTSDAEGARASECSTFGLEHVGVQVQHETRSDFIGERHESSVSGTVRNSVTTPVMLRAPAETKPRDA